MLTAAQSAWKMKAVRVDRRRFNHPSARARRCQCETLDCELVAITARNGVKQFRLICEGCDALAPYNIPHEWLTPAERTRARVVQNVIDFDCWGERWPTCARCGSPDAGIEVHHIAPRAYFADADDWPLILLCPACHKRWHQTMNGYRYVDR
jgi:5-methylcytosine-specific restriction endonuclease McrA